MAFSISGVTDAGKEAVRLAIDNQYQLVFRSIRTGSGIYADGEDISGRTALKSEKNVFRISSRKDEMNGFTLGAILCNYDGTDIVVSESYNVNEIGLYCMVNGTEYLYAMAAVPDDGGRELPAYNGENLTQIVQKWFVGISNDLDIKVEMESAYALAEDVEELKELIKNLSTKLSLVNGTRSDITNQKINIVNNTTGETTIYAYKDGEKVYLTKHGDYTVVPQDESIYVTPHNFTLDHTKTTETIEITIHATKVKAYVGGYVGAYVSSNN